MKSPVTTRRTFLRQLSAVAAASGVSRGWSLPAEPGGYESLRGSMDRAAKCSQIVDGKDARRDGAWGVYSHPFGFCAILDVFAPVLHSLADFHEHIVTTTTDGAFSVHLHFAAETPVVTTRAQRAADATLRITPKQRAEFRIRVPAWASRESVRLKIGDETLPLHWQSSFLIIPRDQVTAGETITLQHDLPTRRTVEEMPVSRRKFTLDWRGNEVVACEPKVPIYPAAPGK